MKKHIHESNLIEGYDDPEFDNQSMKAWKFLARQEWVDRAVVQTLQKTIVASQDDLFRDERGNYRYVQVWVGGHQPPNAQHIPDLMNTWMDRVAKQQLTPKQAHIQFELIHPFVDGNGRTGRMLMWWHEIKLGKTPTLILNSKKQEYYKWFAPKSNVGDKL